MKILAIGFLVLFAWLAGSTYIYVCKIKDLCNERETVLIDKIGLENLRVADSMPNVLADTQVTKPDMLIINFEFDKSEFNPDTKTENWITEFAAYFENHSETNRRTLANSCPRGSSIKFPFKNRTPCAPQP